LIYCTKALYYLPLSTSKLLKLNPNNENAKLIIDKLKTE